MNGEVKYVQIDLFDTDKYEQPKVDETPVNTEGDIKKPKAVYLKKNSYSQHILFGKTAYLLQNENSWSKDTCMRSVRMLAKYIDTGFYDTSEEKEECLSQSFFLPEKQQESLLTKLKIKMKLKCVIGVPKGKGQKGLMYILLIDDKDSYIFDGLFQKRRSYSCLLFSYYDVIGKAYLIDKLNTKFKNEAGKSLTNSNYKFYFDSFMLGLLSGNRTLGYCVYDKFYASVFTMKDEGIRMFNDLQNKSLVNYNDLLQDVFMFCLTYLLSNFSVMGINNKKLDVKNFIAR